VIDIEAILSTYLRGQTSVSDLVADRVYTDLPHTRSYPLVLVNRIGGGYLTGQPHWLESAVMSIQCYGGTHKQAQGLASTVMAAMDSGLRGAYPEGCVTTVKETDLAYDSDADLSSEEGHSRPRFVLTATVIAHPA
jgi:hypothetical protein